MTSLEPKIEKSPICIKLKNFHPHPQLDIKFWNPYECWWQFFIIYISRYIHFLYTHKVWRKLKDPFGTPSHPTPSNKTFSSLQKGLFKFVFLKPREPFHIPIKWKGYSIVPHGSLRADSLRGINHLDSSTRPFTNNLNYCPWEPGFIALRPFTHDNLSLFTISTCSSSSLKLGLLTVSSSLSATKLLLSPLRWHKQPQHWQIFSTMSVTLWTKKFSQKWWTFSFRYPFSSKKLWIR